MTTQTRNEPAKRHGRRGTYVGGCRCESCTAANRDYQREAVHRLRYAKRIPPEHGVNAYLNYVCRCETCRVVWREYRQARRAQGAAS